MRDGTLHCQPVTYASCGPLEVRDSFGNCVKSIDCTASCGSQGGAFDAAFGLCECASATQTKLQCNDECLSLLPSVSIESNGMILRDPVTQEVSILDTTEINIEHAQMYCSKLRVGYCHQSLVLI